VTGLSGSQATVPYKTDEVVDKFVIGKSAMSTLKQEAVNAYILILREIGKSF
jgi:hypothetical protein